MKITWQIDKQDVGKVRSFLKLHQDNAFVKRRIDFNLCKEKPSVSKNQFWEHLVGCLLTTQQRSGPGSPVARVLRTKPFLLKYDLCKSQADVATFAEQTLKRFGGIRRSTRIGSELSYNMAIIVSGGWDAVAHHLEDVRLKATPRSEKKAADYLAGNLSGIGPKQSRNLLQGLGLSKFEIPLDSRITKWLNEFGFPVRLTATALADSSYYQFVSDGFQHLCKACDVLPCVLDAVIFASFDNGKWTKENAVW